MAGVPRSDINDSEVADLYEYGFSQRELGRMLEANSATMCRRLAGRGVQCRPVGMSHKRGGPHYIDSCGYWRTYDRAQRGAYVHRGCWEAYNGLIPEGHHVHHVDGNPLNNEIENLQCMSAGEHISLHRGKAVR